MEGHDFHDVLLFHDAASASETVGHGLQMSSQTLTFFHTWYHNRE